MGIFWLDGFEDYSDQADFVRVYGQYAYNMVINTNDARTGNRCADAAYRGRFPLTCSLVYPSFTPGTIYTGCAVLIETHQSNDNIIIGISANYYYEYNAQLKVLSNGELMVQETSYGTIHYTGVYIELDTWYYFELYCYSHQTLGEYILRMNGSVISTGSNLDTYSNANNNVVTQGHSSALYDDFYVADDGFYGPLKVHTFVPTGDGTHTDFTRNTGSNDWEALDEATPDDDTTYVEGDTQGQKQTIQVTASGITGPILAVQLNNYLTGAGDGPTKVKSLLRSNSTDYIASDEKLITLGNYNRMGQTYTTDPDDSNSWTTSKINSAEFGLVISSLSTTTTTV